MREPKQMSATIYKRQGQWYLRVTDSHGRIVYRDDCRDRTKLISAAEHWVCVVRELARVGHSLEKSYSELVDDMMGKI